MKRPKKKPGCMGVNCKCVHDYNEGRQDMIDFLPSENDIRDLISYNITCTFAEMEKLATKIHKRLGGSE